MQTELGWEEYYDYLFPDEQDKASNLKILEMARKWKKQKTEAASGASAGAEEASAPAPAPAAAAAAPASEAAGAAPTSSGEINIEDL